MDKEKFEQVERTIRNLIDGTSEKFWHVFVGFGANLSRVVEGFVVFPLEKSTLDLIFSRIIEYENKWILGPEDVGSLQFSISMLDIKLIGQTDIRVFSECFDIPVVKDDNQFIRMKNLLFIFGEFPDELLMEKEDEGLINPTATGMFNDRQ